MKNKIIKPSLIFLINFLLASNLFAQNTLRDFSKIVLDNDVNVEVTQGNANTYFVEPIEETSKISVKQIGDELIVTKISAVGNKTKVKITVKTLSDISLKGSGNISSSGTIDLQNIKMSVTGSGNLMMNLKAADIEANVVGSGDIKLTGTTQNLIANITGSGNISAKDLSTENVTVSVQGSGEAIVSALKKMDAKVSGSGNIKYLGNPEVKNIDIVGSGAIQQIGNKEGEINISTDKNDTTRLQLGSKKIMIIGDETKKKTKKKDIKHIWAGVELGLNGYSNISGATTLPGSSMYTLDYLRSTVVNINPFERNFKLYKNYIALTTGLGFQFNRFMFEKDFSIIPLKSGLVEVNSNTLFKKNMLKASYLTIPLLIQFNTNEKHEKSFHFAVGGQFGLRLGSRTKQVWNDDGDKKKEITISNFNLNPIQYGLTARIRYGNFNIFANYNLSNMFKNNKGPQLYAFQIGVTLLSF